LGVSRGIFLAQRPNYGVKCPKRYPEYLLRGFCAKEAKKRAQNGAQHPPLVGANEPAKPFLTLGRLLKTGFVRP
jgi:hypothetical protein